MECGDRQGTPASSIPMYSSIRYTLYFSSHFDFNFHAPESRMPRPGAGDFAYYPTSDQGVGSGWSPYRRPGRPLGRRYGGNTIEERGERREHGGHSSDGDELGPGLRRGRKCGRKRAGSRAKVFAKSPPNAHCNRKSQHDSGKYSLGARTFTIPLKQFSRIPAVLYACICANVATHARTK